MAVVDRSARLAAFADPSRKGYKAVRDYLMVRRQQRLEEQRRSQQSIKLPHRISGMELQRLEQEFSMRIEVVDRAPARAPFAEAKFFLLSLVNKTMKSWDGEEVVVFDADFMTLVVKNEGWVHCCCTYATSEKAAGYEQQIMALSKAIEGRRSDISYSAAEFKVQFQQGRGNRVCADAASCSRFADTLLVDLPRVDVGAEQLCKAVLQHQATRAKVWFFFEPDMFLEDEGELQSMAGKYLIDRRADRVYIFPDESTSAAFEYSFSSMMSYMLQSDVYVDGERFIMEVHDSMPGVKFVQLIKAEFSFPCDSEVDVHYYRESGEAMTVIEQMWFPPAMDGDELNGQQVSGRIVVPTRIVEKVVGRVLSAADKKMTTALGRSAVRDIVSQDVTKGSVVTRPRTLPAHVTEQLAQYAVKRAAKERAEMLMEQSAMSVRVKSARGQSGSWINNVLGLFFSTMDMNQTLLDIPKRVLEGFTVRNDYTYKDYPLEPAYVVRNVVRATTGDGFGARMVSFFPGRGVKSEASSVSSGDYVLFKARAWKQQQACCEADVVGQEVEVVEETLEKEGFKSMSADRDALVEKMNASYDAHNASIGFRESIRTSIIEPPDTSSVAIVQDPISAIMDDYRSLMPVLDDVDFSTRTHLASAADREENTTAAKRVMNREYDVMARNQLIRRSKLKTAGVGARVMTQSEAVLCFDKRVNNAPRCQWPSDFSVEVTRHVDKFFDVCLRKGWQDVVAQRLQSGMWQSRVSELGKNVRKLDQVKVTRALQESFNTGDIDLTKWVAMVKSISKPKVDESAAFEHSATQTIVYQENKMENSYFSSLLSEFHDTLDEVLEPNVRVNVRRDVDDMEQWFNSFRVRRVTLGSRCRSYEMDISQCDKSHTLFNWMVWLEVLRRFGLPDDLTDMWSVMMGKKTASATMVGMMVDFFEQLTSGGFHTISFNSIVCAVACVSAMDLQKHTVVTAQFVGDDSLVETTQDMQEEEVLAIMQNVFNFEAKLLNSEIRYFCSRYYVEFDGWFFMMRDPGKLAESLGRHISSVADVGELWQAYLDSTRNYDREELVQCLPFSFALRTASSFIPSGLVRGLASLRDRDNFFSLYENSVEEISA